MARNPNPNPPSIERESESERAAVSDTPIFFLFSGNQYIPSRYIVVTQSPVVPVPNQLWLVWFVHNNQLIQTERICK